MVNDRLQLVKTSCLQISPFQLQYSPVAVFFRSIGLDLRTLSAERRNKIGLTPVGLQAGDYYYSLSEFICNRTIKSDWNIRQ